MRSDFKESGGERSVERVEKVSHGWKEGEKEREKKKKEREAEAEGKKEIVEQALERKFMEKKKKKRKRGNVHRQVECHGFADERREEIAMLMQRIHLNHSLKSSFGQKNFHPFS